MLHPRNTYRVINNHNTHSRLCYVTPCSRVSTKTQSTKKPQSSKSKNIQRCLASLSPQTFNILPATIGCMAAFIVGYPFDTFKVRLQNDKVKSNNLFTGFVPGILLCGLYASVYFYTYDVLINSSYTINNAASISAITTLVSKVPCKVVIKMMQRYEINNMSKVMIKIYKKNGIQGFFRGFWLYILSDVPENIIKYNMYDFLFKLPFKLPIGVTGILVGIVTSVCVQPIDVLINVIMTNLNDRNIQFKKINYMKGLRLSLITNTIQSFTFYHVYNFLQFL
jgi:hypothetical protein